jgi:phosphatidate cytidylyltransferase
MHLKRILSGLVALPCFYLIISKGGLVSFAILVNAACMIAMWEYYGLVLSGNNTSRFGLIPVVGYISGTAIIWSIYSLPSPFAVITGILIGNMIISAAIGLTRFGEQKDIMDVVAKEVQGVIYIPLLLSTLILVRNDAANGSVWIYFILILVASCDTGAFYAGTYLGRNKLCPSVSPGKTVEGLLGGILFSVVIGSAIKYFFIPEIDWLYSILFCIAVGLVGPAGDLFESVLKRSANIKDSGSIIPGHGGMLDRIDALLFVAPVACIFKQLMT